MATAFIGLGSNIDPERNLVAAVGLLREELRLTGISPVYRTAPWGLREQAHFLNAAVSAKTNLAPLELLDRLQAIETRLQRRRAIRWGPRSIDLDLLCYNDLVYSHPRLQVPHSLLHERAFALRPLCDLTPQLKHPTLGKTMAELLDRMDQTGIAMDDLRLDSSPAASG